MGRLEITTHIGCPIDCSDCPQALLRSRYTGSRTMKLADYKKAIDKLPPGTRVDFSGMCEPFANRDCTQMILYAAERGLPLALYTTLQGATRQDLQDLQGVQFEVVTIHLPDQERRGHFNITQEYLDLLRDWPCHNYSCHGTVDSRVRPYIDLRRNLITYMHDRAGNLPEHEHRNLDPNRKLWCITSGRAMDHNVLLPDGTVLTCCMDYGATGRFGNLFEQEYNEVLHSPEAERMRATLDQGESICRHCSNARPI